MSLGEDGHSQLEAGFKVTAQFLPDVTVPCEICQGRRYNREALEVTMRDQSIADVLSMTVAQALDFFYNFPRIRPKLETLRDVGLGYIRLGQPATTLFGGEARCFGLGQSCHPFGRPGSPGSRCFMGISVGLALVEGLLAAAGARLVPDCLMRAPSVERGGGKKRLGRRLDGRRGVRRPCTPHEKHP